MADFLNATASLASTTNGLLLSISDFTAVTSRMFCPSDDRSLNVKINDVFHFGGLEGSRWVLGKVKVCMIKTLHWTQLSNLLTGIKQKKTPVGSLALLFLPLTFFELIN